MTIKQDSVVTIAYTVTDEDGEVIDSSEINGEFAYLHGHENLVPGIETLLLGQTVGAHVVARIEPEQGYGVRDESKMYTIGRDRLPQEQSIEPGAQFPAESPDGERLMLTVTSIDGDQVTLDANHPLAGLTLDFDVHVRDIREATPEEIDHGHVHDGEHHHH